MTASWFPSKELLNCSIDVEHLSIYRLADVVHALFALDREPYAPMAFLKIANSWVLRALSDAPGSDLRSKACRAFAKMLGRSMELLKTPWSVRPPCSPRTALRIDSIRYNGCVKFLVEWGAEYAYRLVYDERIRQRAVRGAAANLAAYALYGLKVDGPYAGQWLSLIDEAEEREPYGTAWKPFMSRILVDIIPQCGEVGVEIWA
ncbi:MAG: hypothetical protein ABWJ97_05425 [Thermoproteus sp.]